MMKFALNIPNCGGDYADARLVAQVAHEAEEAGWDGFFIWDHIGDKWGEEVSDPWILLAAVAMRTKYMKLGTMVSPLPRRRPCKLAREITTLDQMTGGRMILGVGIGGGIENKSYHEQNDKRILGEMLDEGLEILDRLWSGEYVNYEGKHYQLTGVRHLPRPIQQPRIPIWVGGVWPNKKPMRRAALWDGAYPIGKGLSSAEQMSPVELHECACYIRSQRSTEKAAQPFDLAHWGALEGKDKEADATHVRAYAEAGATWWIENMCQERGTLQEMRPFISKGPPYMKD